MSTSIAEPIHTCANHAISCIDNHHHHHLDAGKSKSTRIMEVLEKISAIALGVFSAFTDLKLFAPFFLIGAAIGVYSYFKQDKCCHESTSPASACSQGFLEHLTGVKLPAPISLAANIAVTICHIDHHATVFVPIVGLSVGNWVGKNATHYGSLLYHKIEAHCQQRQRLLATA